MAGTSASVAAEFEDGTYDDVRPEDDDWSTISVVGGRATRRLDRSPADGSARVPAIDSARAFVNGLTGRGRSGPGRSAALSTIGAATSAGLARVPAEQREPGAEDESAARSAGGRTAEDEGTARLVDVSVGRAGAGRRAGDAGVEDEGVAWKGAGSAGRRAAGLQVVRAAGLGGVVRTAGERDVEVVAATRTLPVLAGLRELLPGGGLRRGATVAVHTSSVLLALLAAASGAGSWCAVVGLPGLSPIAAAEMGIALERLALVPHPGTEWTTIVAALLDGFDIVVAAPPGAIAPVVAGRLAARARQRGSVLMAAGSWAGADLTLAPVGQAWSGLGAGRGRLRGRELTIQARGRGAAAAPREATLRLPEITGVLPPVTTIDPGEAARNKAGEVTTISPGEVATISPGAAARNKAGEVATISPGEAARNKSGEVARNATGDGGKARPADLRRVG